MSTQQKSALYQLAVCAATLVLYFVLRRTAGASVAPTALSLLALVGFVPLLFRGEMGDERERHVARRAAIVGLAASYFFIVASCMGLWTLHTRRGDATIDIELLPLIVLGAFVVVLVVRAAAVLLLAPRAWDVAE